MTGQECRDRASGAGASGQRRVIPKYVRTPYGGVRHGAGVIVPAVERQRRTWVIAEVESEPWVRQPTEQPDEPGHARTRAYLVEADGRASERRVHKIATKYAPSGDYSVSGGVSLGDAEASEQLRFSVPAEEADAVLASLRQEVGVRSAWLGESYLDT